jgi:hypothetical protein
LEKKVNDKIVKVTFYIYLLNIILTPISIIFFIAFAQNNTNLKIVINQKA